MKPKKKNYLTVASILMVHFLNAQIPTEVPKPSESPIDFSNPADVIIYVVLPICAILFFILWRRRQKNKNS